MNEQVNRERAGVAYLVGIIGALLIVAGLVWTMHRYTTPEPLVRSVPKNVPLPSPRCGARIRKPILLPGSTKATAWFAFGLKMP
jgi:hypothetical protein